VHDLSAGGALRMRPGEQIDRTTEAMQQRRAMARVEAPMLQREKKS